MIVVMPRCAGGCDGSFLQYVTWKGTSLRILKDTYSRDDGPRWAGVLRCADCGDQVIFSDLPFSEKVQLDLNVEAAMTQMQGLEQEFDQAHAERQAAFNRYLEETHRA